MTECARRLRCQFAEWPVVSLWWRWLVLHGSTVVDYAHDKRMAERRARRFIAKDGWSAKKWNSVSIERACNA